MKITDLIVLLGKAKNEYGPDVDVKILGGDDLVEPAPYSSRTGELDVRDVNGKKTLMI